MHLLIWHMRAAQLTLTSQPQTSRTYCPGPVTFTCVGTRVAATLLWEVNGSTVVTIMPYGFRDTDTFPFFLSVSPPLDGVMAAITSASSNPPGAFTIDITSVLSVGAVSILNGTSLQCVTNNVQEVQSNMLEIAVYGKLYL